MTTSPTPPRSSRPSLVWPIVLIGAGVIFLLANLNLLPDNTWRLLARLWPVALIIIGLDVLIGRRSTVGSILSGLLTLAVIGSLIAVLLLAPNIPALSELTEPAERQSETIQAPRGEVESARVTIDWNPGRNSLSALPPGSPNLIEGEVEYYGNLIFDVKHRGSSSVVRLDARMTSVGFGWFDYGSLDWAVALHPDVAYDLTLDTGSGQHELDLSELQLSQLKLDSGSGPVTMSLPPGGYTARIDGGSGPLTITLPEGVAARVELDSGSGPFNPAGTLELVEGRANDDGAWETANYDDASRRILLIIDQGSGPVTISEQ